jgi:transposase
MDKQKANGLEIAAWVGWDWADKQHEVAIQQEGSAKVERQTIAQQPERLREWVEGMRARFGGAKIAIAIEQARGPVIYALMSYDFIVLYPINPKSLARFREALRPSRAKDDPADAELLLELITKHRDRFRPWMPDDHRVREMRTLVEYRRTTVNEQGRYAKRLKSVLKSYFPQALEFAGDLTEEIAWDFLTHWPTLEAVKEAGEAAIREFYLNHRCRRKTIDERVNQISEATPLTSDTAVVAASVMLVQITINQLRCFAEAIEKFEKRIRELYADYPDRDLFDSFPGAGPVLAPRLAVAWGLERSRYQSADEVLRFSGVAPVTEASGKSKWVHRSYARPKFLHQTFVEYAKQSVVQSTWAKAYYADRKRLNHSRNDILRSLAFKWIRIMYRCWRDRVPYDESSYLTSLQRRGSYLAQLASEVRLTEVCTESAD